MRKRRTASLILIAVLAIMLLSVALVACTGDYSGEHTVPEINRNEVLFIERNRLSFVKDMTVDSADVIEKCGITFRNNDGSVKKATAQDLADGIIAYEEFDLEAVGSNKQIRVTYGNVVNYIFYDVNDYKVNFYLDEAQKELWTTAGVSAALTDDLGLAVWVNLNQYNYSIDEDARITNPDLTSRFDGWFDSSSNAATGLYTLSAPLSGNERIINLHAHYISKQELADYNITYDGLGRRVFAGYVGAKTDKVTIPEGVTYVDLKEVFKNGAKFERLHIPSTARMDFPLMSGVDTTGISELTVDAGNLYYSSYNGALYSKDYELLYLMPASAKQLKFHSAMKEFESYSCAYLNRESLTIPEGVTVLRNYCFAYSHLRNILGIQNVKTIMSGVFYNSNINMWVDDDGIGLYNILPLGDNGSTYILSMIFDDTIESYTVFPGTVAIAGDVFKNCKSLKTVTMTDGLESIGSSAFSGCSALTSVRFPRTVKYLGEKIFYECTSLQKVENLPNINFRDSSDGKEYPNTLPTQMFYKCSSLSDITLPNKLVQIGPSAFYNCSALTSITLPQSLKTIGSAAFRGCGFEAIDLPSGLQSLGTQAFAYTSLKSIDLSGCTSLRSLPSYLFYYCQSLEEFTFPDRYTEVPEHFFYYASALKKVNLGKVKTIRQYGLGYALSLNEIVWSDVERIDENAFRYCLRLTEVSLPDSVEYVGGYAFGNCTALTSITLGKNVRTFGSYSLADDGVTINNGAKPVLWTCISLREINVSPQNTYFNSIDGALYGREIGGKDLGENSVLYYVPSNYTSETLTFPSSVKALLPYAVSFQITIKTVTLNDGLVSIGAGAFYFVAKSQTKGPSSLTSPLVIPKTTASIGGLIVSGCASLTKLEISPDNPYYSADGSLVYKDNELSMLIETALISVPKNVVIADGVTTIGSAVFMSKSIESVVISDDVTEIGANAFKECTKLKSITIGKGVSVIDPTSFARLASLERIEVDPDNPYFKAENNVLYTKNGKKVILCAAKNGMTTLNLLSTVTEIGDYAFSDHATLNEVILPEGVKSIGDYAFYECKQISKFYGAKSLEIIGKYAFAFKAPEGTDPATKKEWTYAQKTQLCNTLKTVMLFSKTKSIGDYAFYGHYGITHAYFNMSYDQVLSLISHSGKNKTYLTHGCPLQGTGKYVNNDGEGVIRCIYSEVEPSIDHDGYSWYFIDEDGEPVIWIKTIEKEVL